MVITLILALSTGIFGYGQLIEKSEETAKKVEEIKAEMKEHNGEINELENFSIKQTILLDSVQKQMDMNLKILERLLEK